MYDWQKENAGLSGCSDTDWAGCKLSGQSTSGGLIQIGTHLIKCWSRTQDPITLSFAEAELVALGKLAMEMLGVRSMCREWIMT